MRELDEELLSHAHVDHVENNSLQVRDSALMDIGHKYSDHISYKM